jgi:hypothetical protein
MAMSKEGDSMLFIMVEAYSTLWDGVTYEFGQRNTY